MDGPVSILDLVLIAMGIYGLYVIDKVSHE